MNNEKGATLPKYITRRQEVKPAKIKISRQLRRDMTDSEKKLWQHLRANKLNGRHFRRQQIIDGFIVDFYCDKTQLVIEIDGEIHENQKDLDYAREVVLRNRGLKITRFTNSEITKDMDKVLFQIEKECNEQC